MEAKGRINTDRRGPRRGEAVEKRPPGQAEQEAARPEDNVPLDARTGKEIDPKKGLMERRDAGESDVPNDRKRPG
jgi:hypothetical protein